MTENPNIPELRDRALEPPAGQERVHRQSFRLAVVVAAEAGIHQGSPVGTATVVEEVLAGTATEEEGVLADTATRLAADHGGTEKLLAEVVPVADYDQGHRPNYPNQANQFLQPRSRLLEAHLHLHLLGVAVDYLQVEEILRSLYHWGNLRGYIRLLEGSMIRKEKSQKTRCELAPIKQGEYEK